MSAGFLAEAHASAGRQPQSNPVELNVSGLLLCLVLNKISKVNK